MDMFRLPSPLEEISHHPGTQDGIRIFIKRDDLIHPHISGNKWRKLKYNIEEAKKQQARLLITAGGPWSNHLAATAAAGKILGFKTLGLVRGTGYPSGNETLEFCQQQGMQLVFVPKKEFEQIPQNMTKNIIDWMEAYFIPMGGGNELGIQGCREIIDEIDIPFDMICLPVGTGTTFMGVAGAAGGKQVWGFSAVKDDTQHSAELIEWVQSTSSVQLIYEYSLGGFARSAPELENFIVDFYLQNKILLEPVYTGKMMYGLFDRIQKGQVQPGVSIVCIHTGGLQGLQGFPDLHRRLFTS